MTFETAGNAICEFCVHLWLYPSAFLQKRTNYLHSLSLFWTRAQLRHAALHSAHPVRARRCSRNIKAIFAREYIGNHHNCDPRFTLEKPFHHRRVKVAFEIDLLARAGES